ncbi:MAG: hypothetical protein H0W08_17450 [Acidobacteria bacterium]|nr:hypothetical protein [Acidobacteriota bacterium]
MRARVFAIGILAALPLGSVAAAGQGRGQADARVRAMDRNGDGVITPAEWRGSAESFRNRDRNRDGRLSGNELRAGAGGSDEQYEDYFPPPEQEFDDWTEEGFDYLDRNRDGRLSRAEWFHDRGSFLRADRNRDNILSRAEFLGDADPYPSAQRQDRFEDLDANDNNRIERGEWTRGLQSFNALDTNGNGVLSRAEFLADDSPRDERFETLDANDNGRIEAREWQGRTDRFDELDRNNDGVLTRNELPGETGAGGSEIFDTADENRDNRLSESEWRWSRRAFAQQDVNRDGFVARREFSAPADAAFGAAGGRARGEDRGLDQPIVVNVNASERWTDTGLDLRSGDLLRITSTGTVRLGLGADDGAGPGGGNRRAPGALLPNHPAGALIGRIGEGLPFFIGDGSNINRVQTTGRLYLGVNDDHLQDNEGSFRVTVGLRGQ